MAAPEEDLLSKAPQPVQVNYTSSSRSSSTGEVQQEHFSAAASANTMQPLCLVATIEAVNVQFLHDSS
jgi:hypothetical protein